MKSAPIRIFVDIILSTISIELWNILFHNSV